MFNTTCTYIMIVNFIDGGHRHTGEKWRKTKMSTSRLREKQTIHLSHNSFWMIIRLRKFIFIKRMYQMNTPAIVGIRTTSLFCAATNCICIYVYSTDYIIAATSPSFNLQRSHKGNNKITDHRAIFQRERQNS